MAANLRIALSPYVSQELSDFDQIWYNMCISILRMVIDNNQNFANSTRRTDATLKILLWLYLGGTYRIACKQRSRDQSSNFRQFDIVPATSVVFRRLATYVILVIIYSYLTYFNRCWSFSELLKTANIT